MKPSYAISRWAKPTSDEVAYILKHLRPEDQFELGCSGFAPERIQSIVAAAEHDHVWYINDTPVFAFGLLRLGQVAHLWGFGTTKTKYVIPSATRWGLSQWLPDMFEAEGIKRIEVRVPHQSKHSIAWLKKLGMTVECDDLRDCCDNGAVMTQLAYTTREYRRDYVFPPTENSGRGSPRPGPRHTSRHADKNDRASTG